MAEVFGKDGARTLRTVITFLEMARRPTRPRRAAPRRGLAIRRAERPPPGFYLRLYRAVGGGFHWTDRLSWTEERLIETIHDADVEIHVLHAGGAPAGFVELDFRRGDIAELGLFGLLPDFTGQGLGGYFLDWAIEALWRPGIGKVAVDTNTRDHPRALAMYRKAGFRVVRREESYLVPAERFAGV